jgi:hypothetical protein
LLKKKNSDKPLGRLGKKEKRLNKIITDVKRDLIADTTEIQRITRDIMNNHI